MSKYLSLSKLLGSSVVVFGLFASTELADLVGLSSLNFIENSRCYDLLGCNVGFFGFDAVSHFIGGVLWSVLAIWLMKRFPRVSLFHSNLWKSFFVLICLIAFIHVLWELYEFSKDLIHAALSSTPLLFNDYAQPSGIDTMGDLTFGILGAVVAFLFVRAVDPGALKNGDSEGIKKPVV